MAFWDFITDALSYLGESQLEVTEAERQMQEVNGNSDDV